MQDNLPLRMAQIQADMFMAKTAIERAESIPARKAKYIKGQGGYHLQQAAEKMIKIQMYASGKPLDNAKIYKHKIFELISYANSIGIQLVLPAYIDKNSVVISNWEAEGRYDISVVVKINQLKKCYDEISTWYEQLIDDGYK